MERAEESHRLLAVRDKKTELIESSVNLEDFHCIAEPVKRWQDLVDHSKTPRRPPCPDTVIPQSRCLVL